MNAVIWGCGDVGIAAKKKLEADGITVLAFTDNDSDKWGSLFEELPVICPRKITELSPDLVAIGVYKAANSIKGQLRELGIPEEQTIIPIEADRIFPCPFPIEEARLDSLCPDEYESENTQRYCAEQIVICDSDFLSKLEDLKQVLRENNIPRFKVCIVGGAVRQAYGERSTKKFDDIDLIMTSDLRELYGKGLVIVSETAELHPQNEYFLSDDEIIEDTRYHFVYNDFKFACLEVLKRIFV